MTAKVLLIVGMGPEIGMGLFAHGPIHCAAAPSVPPNAVEKMQARSASRTECEARWTPGCHARPGPGHATVAGSSAAEEPGSEVRTTEHSAHRCRIL